MYCTRKNTNRLSRGANTSRPASAGSVEWISHRGLCYPGVENTLEAFQYADQVGFRHFETDLRCTADGVIILWHDETLRRGSSNSLAKRKIHTLSWPQLRSLRLHDGQPVCTLDGLFEAFSDRHWIFDIKPETAAQTIAQLAHEFDHLARWRTFLTEQVRFLLWNSKDQTELLKCIPSARLMPRLGECRRAGLCNLLGLPSLGRIRAHQTYAVPPRFMGMNLMTEEFVQRYQQLGAQVLAYLPNSEQEVRAAIAAGVDEILLNGQPMDL